jgi:hypothetical protein
MHSHPNYLDCVIFPYLREQAVKASVLGKLDHVEFFLDLMHGGLVCWGTSSPEQMGRAGRRLGKGNRRGMGAQVPWDTRSWEARRWFLEKWKDLVGTEEEEEERGEADGIWRCSRWWWNLRGEEDGYESDDAGGEGESDEEEETEEQILKKMYEGVNPDGLGASRFDLTGVVWDWNGKENRKAD